jgi:hypothetical protein
VLVVTPFGGLIGDIVGLILAVPVFVIARSAIGPATVGRLLRPGGRPRRTDPATTARLRWAT